MLEGEVADPSYKKRRESALLIGTDCGSIWPTCFCDLVGLKPYPESGVDMNLSRAENGFAVDIISHKGQEFFEEFAYFFRDSTPEEREEASHSRRRTVALLQELNKEFNYKLPIHQTIKGTLNSPLWREITRFCIECGSCNLSCPSCTCFTFGDQKVDGVCDREKLWDACLKAAYAKVAGGANSRPYLHQRYNNRLQCKFDYSYDRINMYTCTGCGRCIETCPAKIDMRAAIRDLEKALALRSVKLE